MIEKYKIFILDDVELIGKQIAFTLNKDERYTTQYFTTIRELYAHVDPQNPPDLLIVDYLLEEGTCEDLVKDFRKLIPTIICVTGTDAFSKGDILEALYKAGVTDIKSKTNLASVYRSVDTVFRRRKTEVIHGSSV